MAKVLIATDKPFAPVAVKGIKEIFDTAGYETVVLEKYGTQEAFAQAVADVDALIVRSDKVDAEILDAAKNLKIVVRAGAGYDNLDLEGCTAKGVVAMNTPGQNSNAVAELAFGMMVMVARGFYSGKAGTELKGKKIGIHAYGNVGQNVGRIAKGFGMNVIAYDLFPDKNADINYVSLDEVFTKSDIISLHCPLTKETHYIIDDDAISKMKDGVIIVNTSRGALINAEDLLNGLKSMKIGGACLDVYEEESEIFFEDFSGEIIQDDVLARLLSLPNVIITSHQAFLTEEALSNIAKTTLGNIKEYFMGEEPVNKIHPEAI